MPAPSDVYIQLRFQLCRFRGVYRVARLPLTFTFAHLAKLVLLLFGWSGMHAHAAEVVANVEMYARASARRGEIKRYARAAPAEPDRGADPQGWTEWMMRYGMCRFEPEMRVVSRRGQYYGADGPEEWGVPVREEAEVTLGDLWATERVRNLTRGACTNQQIGIKFEYDLGASWNVDITIEAEEDGTYMWRDPGARMNRPIITVAKGAPPIEDCSRDIRDELEGKLKTVSPLLFSEDVFEKYLAGEIGSTTRKKDLAVYNVGEERARMKAARERKETEWQARMKEKEEGLARGEARIKEEEDEDEGDEDEGDEDDDDEH